MTEQNIAIFLDTETSGIPYWSERSNLPKQPHIVSIAALKVDLNSKEVLDYLDLIVKPDGWESHPDALAVHGITTDEANAVGIDEHRVINEFYNFWGGLPRFSHSKNFDNRIVRIALSRFMSSGQADEWKAGESGCTMQMAKSVGGKQLARLDAAYEHFVGHKIDGQHSAMGDAVACMELYFSIVNRGI